jgi:predicted transcriptional regulator
VTGKTDAAKVAEAARLYHSARLTAAEIARVMKVNERTIRRWLAGTTRRTGPRGRTDVRDELILALRDRESLCYAEIGRRTGMSETGARQRYWVLTGRERADRRKTTDTSVAGNGETGEPSS